MRIEGDKEFRIYCDDVEKWSFGLITPGFCSMLEEAYDEMHGRKNRARHWLVLKLDFEEGKRFGRPQWKRGCRAAIARNTGS